MTPRLPARDAPALHSSTVNASQDASQREHHSNQTPTRVFLAFLTSFFPFPPCDALTHTPLPPFPFRAAANSGRMPRSCKSLMVRGLPRDSPEEKSPRHTTNGSPTHTHTHTQHPNFHALCPPPTTKRESQSPTHTQHTTHEPKEPRRLPTDATLSPRTPTDVQARRSGCSWRRKCVTPSRSSTRRSTPSSSPRTSPRFRKCSRRYGRRSIGYVDHTPGGCQIGHMDRTGCHGLVSVTVRPARVVTPGPGVTRLVTWTAPGVVD